MTSNTHDNDVLGRADAYLTLAADGLDREPIAVALIADLAAALRAQRPAHSPAAGAVLDGQTSFEDHIGDVWAVLTSMGCPTGASELQWFSDRDQREVDELVGGKHGAVAVDSFHVTRTRPDRVLRAQGSDVALLFPDDYPENPLARQVLMMLAGRPVDQAIRGNVALAEYDVDPVTGEVGFPVPMSAETIDRIAHLAAHPEAMLFGVLDDSDGGS